MYKESILNAGYGKRDGVEGGGKRQDEVKFPLTDCEWQINMIDLSGYLFPCTLFTRIMIILFRTVSRQWLAKKVTIKRILVFFRELCFLYNIIAVSLYIIYSTLALPNQENQI